jgi:hypothetical protein
MGYIAVRAGLSTGRSTRPFLLQDLSARQGRRQFRADEG